MLTVEEAAAKFCVCPDTVRYWVRSGKVTGARLERVTLPSGKHVRKFLLPKEWAPEEKKPKETKDMGRKRKKAEELPKVKWDKEHGDPVSYIWRHSSDMTVRQLAEEMGIPTGMVCRFFDEGLRRYA